VYPAAATAESARPTPTELTAISHACAFVKRCEPGVKWSLRWPLCLGGPEMLAMRYAGQPKTSILAALTAEARVESAAGLGGSADRVRGTKTESSSMWFVAA
jgi:hypothetical protein